MRDSTGKRLDSFEVAKISGNRFMPVGDSKTYLDAGNLSDNPLLTVASAYVNGSKSDGIYAWANAQLGHRLKMVGNGGVPGDTTEQILARMDALLAIPSDIVSVEGGTNDFAQGWPASRTITALSAIYAKVRAKGPRLVVLTTMSRSTMNNTAGYAYLATVNQFIKNYARKTPGVILADICSAMTDPATGIPYISPFHTADGTHQNAIGAQAMGKILADSIRPFLPSVDVFSSNNLDPLNYMRNACNTGTTGTVANGITGTPGTQWSLSAGSGTVDCAVSKVARTDGLPGEWTRLTIGATNTANIIASGGVLWDLTGANGLKPGDIITAAIEVRTTGLVGVSQFNGGAYHPNSQHLALKNTWQQGSGTVKDNTYTLMVEGATIQAAATYIQARVSVTATSGILDIGRAAVFKTIT